MFRLFKYLPKPYWPFFILIIFISICQVYMELNVPFLMQNIVNFIIAHSSTSLGSSYTSILPGFLPLPLPIPFPDPSINLTNSVLVIGAWMVLFISVSFALGTINRFISYFISNKWMMNIRRNVFTTISSFSNNEISKFSNSHLISVASWDVNNLQGFYPNFFITIIYSPIMIIWSMVCLFILNWAITICVVVLIGVVLVVVSALGGATNVPWRKMLNYNDELNENLRDNLTGLKIIRAYNGEQYFNKKFNTINEKIKKNNNKLFMLNASIGIVFGFIGSLLIIAIYVVGAYLINTPGAKTLDLGTLVTISLISGVTSGSIVAGSLGLGAIPQILNVSKRINAVLKTKPEIKESGKQISDFHIKGSIIFDNVSFKYPNANKNTLENISFSVKKGQTLAIVGSTGSGKTTMINLIPRLFDATSGDILIDGIPIKDISLKTLRSKIGYISQKNILLRGTVYENIAFGIQNIPKQIEEKKVVEASNISDSEPFIEKLPKKYEDLITQDGTNLSGGQKQRLAIARAIAIKPEFLIFDDSFSALDFKTDKKIRKNLLKNLRNSTFIVVAQRINTILNADKIIVLEQGRIVGQGKHLDLYKTCPAYRNIVLTQMSEQEALNYAK